MRILGIIPARGGSKRILNKNIRPLDGKPLIAYTIEAARKAKYLDRVIVSTDSPEIAKVARKYKSEVPFMRPASLAQDSTPDAPVFRHALDWLRKHENYEPEIIVNLRPTTPFKTAATIDKVIQRLLRSKAEVVRTITKVEGVHHPFWLYKLSKDGRMQTFIKDMKVTRYYQSQSLPPVYRLNGVVDAIRTQVVYEGCILDNRNMIGEVIPEAESIDIDTEFDLIQCEFIMKLKRKR